VNPVVVIGAGLAGLSAAFYLTGRGYDVTVVEREQLPGGRTGVLHRDGFTFDTGPTVLTMPDLIADAIRAATRDPGASLRDMLPMRRLDPAYRACFADGSTISVRFGREAMREEIAQTCGSVDAAAFDSFVDWLRQLYLVEMPNFIDRNYDSPLGLLSSPRALAQLIKLGAFGRLVARFGPCALRGDHLHGHHRGRLVSRGRHVCGPYDHGSGCGEGRCDFPLRRPRGNDLALTDRTTCWRSNHVWGAYQGRRGGLHS
jgi:phytoene dehydrogenase-like protein